MLEPSREGALQRYALMELLEGLRMEAYGAILRCFTSDFTVRLYFQRGVPVFIVSSRKHHSLPAFLVRQRVVSQSDLDEMVGLAKTERKPLDELLKEHDLVSTAQMGVIKQSLGQSILCDLFDQPTLKYALDKGSVPPNMGTVTVDVFRAFFLSLRDHTDWSAEAFVAQWGNAVIQRSARWQDGIGTFASVFEKAAEAVVAGIAGDEHCLNQLIEDGHIPNAARLVFAMANSGMIEWGEAVVEDPPESGVEESPMDLDAKDEQSEAAEADEVADADESDEADTEEEGETETTEAAVDTALEEAILDANELSLDDEIPTSDTEGASSADSDEESVAVEEADAEEQPAKNPSKPAKKSKKPPKTIKEEAMGKGLDVDDLPEDPMLRKLRQDRFRMAKQDPFRMLSLEPGACLSAIRDAQRKLKGQYEPGRYEGTYLPQDSVEDLDAINELLDGVLRSLCVPALRLALEEEQHGPLSKKRLVHYFRAERLYQQGRQLHRSNQKRKALKTIRASIAEYGRDPMYHVWAGFILWELLEEEGHSDAEGRTKVRENIRTALQLNETLVMGRLLLARLERHEGHADIALELYEGLLEDHPRLAEAREAVDALLEQPQSSVKEKATEKLTGLFRRNKKS